MLLLYIINYDIKYRMGREAGKEEGEWSLLFSPRTVSLSG